MLQPSILTWVLIVFGFLFVFLPLLYSQLMVVLNPHSQKTKDLIIVKGKDYRDKTHFRMVMALPGLTSYFGYLFY